MVIIREWFNNCHIINIEFILNYPEFYSIILLLYIITNAFNSTKSTKVYYYYLFFLSYTFIISNYLIIFPTQDFTIVTASVIFVSSCTAFIVLSDEYFPSHITHLKPLIAFVLFFFVLLFIYPLTSFSLPSFDNWVSYIAQPDTGITDHTSRQNAGLAATVTTAGIGYATGAAIAKTMPSAGAKAACMFGCTAVGIGVGIFTSYLYGATPENLQKVIPGSGGTGVARPSPIVRSNPSNLAFIGHEFTTITWIKVFYPFLFFLVFRLVFYPIGTIMVINAITSRVSSISITNDTTGYYEFLLVRINLVMLALSILVIVIAIIIVIYPKILASSFLKQENENENKKEKKGKISQISSEFYKTAAYVNIIGVIFIFVSMWLSVFFVFSHPITIDVCNQFKEYHFIFIYYPMLINLLFASMIVCTVTGVPLGINYVLTLVLPKWDSNKISGHPIFSEKYLYYIEVSFCISALFLIGITFFLTLNFIPADIGRIIDNMLKTHWQLQCY